MSGRLNWLRAGVLGANDGIVSIAGLVVGVAAANDSRLVPADQRTRRPGRRCAVDGGRRVRVGQHPTGHPQVALLDKERRELRELPAEELDETTGIYVGKGLSPELAREVAEQLTERDALRAHAEAELGVDPEEVVRPWQAAWASMLSFTVGALLPLTILLTPVSVRIPLCFVAVLIALALTGTISARLGGASPLRAAVRTVVGGAIAMIVTYAIGALVGVSL